VLSRLLDIAPTTTMGVPKYINSIMCPPFGQFYKKVVLRLNEHGDVIDTQTIKVCPPQNFLVNLVPASFCGLWVWRRRTNRRPCCPPMSNPSASASNVRPGGSGWWDNRLAAQQLPRDL